MPAYALTVGKTAWFGAPVEAPAGIVFVLDLLGALASVSAALMCLIIAGVLFWRKADDWMIIFISFHTFLHTGQCWQARWRERKSSTLGGLH
jgi:hypothetical protein